MKVPYLGPKNIRSQRTQFSRHGEMATGNCEILL